MRILLIHITVGLITTFNLSAQTKSDSIKKIDLDQIVVTAQYGPTETRETVNSVRILSRKVIEIRAAVNLQELLQAEPNIRLSQDGILGSGISINGLRGNDVKILVDGIPLVGRLNGSIDAGQIPLNNIQKIEIIEGAQSLIYGSEASGGVINLITKKSQVSKHEAEVSSQYETNGFKNMSARLGSQLGKWFLQSSGNILQFQPNVDTAFGRDQFWNPKKQLNANGIIRYSSSETLKIRLSANVMSEIIHNDGDIRRPTFKPYAFDDVYKNSRFDCNFNLEKRTKNQLLIQSQLGLSSFLRIKNSFRKDFDDNKLSLITGEQDTSSARGLLARFTLASDRKDKILNYLIGIENFAEFATGLRIVDTTASNKSIANTNDLGIFGSGKLKIGSQLVLQSGARVTLNKRYGTAITPSTWLLWKPNLPLQARFSWAYGFRSPSVKELFFNFVDINHFVFGNVNLLPEKSINLRGELSSSTWKLKNVELSITGAAFYNKIKNRIILSQIENIHYEYKNLNIWETKGGSIRLKVQIGEKISFQSDVVRTAFYNTISESNASVAKFSWSTDWVNDLNIQLLGDKLSINFWHKRTGVTPYFIQNMGETQQLISQSWSMYNVGFSTYCLGKKLRLNAGLKNIANIKQVQSNNSTAVHIDAGSQQGLHWGRNFYVGATYLLSRTIGE